MTRFQLELNAVKYIKTARGGFALARARFSKGMKALGYNDAVIYQAWVDCWDVASLEKQSEILVIEIG